MKAKLLIVLFIIIALVVGDLYWFSGSSETPSPEVPEETLAPGWNRAELSDMGILFAYPSRAELYTKERREEVRGLTYIPVCDPDTMSGCVVYGKDAFPGSTFSGSAVSFAVLPINETECYSVDNAPLSSGEKVFDTVAFRRYEVGDAAAGHYLKGNIYRGWKDVRCLEMKSTMTMTNIGVYEPGTIKEFTEAEQAVLFAEMESVLDTIRFQWVMRR